MPRVQRGGIGLYSRVQLRKREREKEKEREKEAKKLYFCLTFLEKKCNLAHTHTHTHHTHTQADECVAIIGGRDLGHDLRLHVVH